jgi:hypothetical protein
LADGADQIAAACAKFDTGQDKVLKQKSVVAVAGTAFITIDGIMAGTAAVESQGTVL